MSEALFESAQALLAGYDAAKSREWRDEDRKWREEDRHWRQEDIKWREHEKDKMQIELDFVSSQEKWRGQDVEQRVLDNARFMWDRAVEKNRRAVEERAEQLKEVSNISALIGGFALIAFLEFSFDHDEIPTVLVYGFGLTTALTVGLMVNSMVTCSFMHASVLKTGRMYVSESEEAKFLFACRAFAENHIRGLYPPKPARTFEKHWDQRCEKEWRRAFYCFATGIPIFMLNLAFAGLIKFHEEKQLGIMIAVIVFLAFFIYLRSCVLWASHLLSNNQGSNLTSTDIEPVGLPFDWHLVSHLPHEDAHNYVPQQEQQSTNQDMRTVELSQEISPHTVEPANTEKEQEDNVGLNFTDPESLHHRSRNPRQDSMSSRFIHHYNPFHSVSKSSFYHNNSMQNSPYRHQASSVTSDTWWDLISEWFLSFFISTQNPSNQSASFSYQ